MRPRVPEYCRVTPTECSLLGEPGVVDRKPAKHLPLRPLADRHALLQALAHALDLGPFVDQSRSEWLDALALAIQQQPREVEPERFSSLGASHAVGEPD